MALGVFWLRPVYFSTFARTVVLGLCHGGEKGYDVFGRKSLV